MPAHFDRLFRQWYEANEAACAAEGGLQQKLLAVRLHHKPMPEQEEIDAARASRATADRLMEATLAALRHEVPEWKPHRAGATPGE